MFDIPSGEFERFTPYLKTYHKGAPIIVEGQQDDKGVFLLRSGRVGVYKNQGDKRDQIAIIEAVNFFGETALATSGPRSVSVDALTDEVIVYSFKPADVQALMNNPKWGYMLCSRLAMNLKNSQEQIAELVIQKNQLNEELQQLQNKTGEIFSYVNSAHKAMMAGTVLNAREYQYLNALNKLLDNLIQKRLPVLKDKLTSVTPTHWRHLNEEGIVPGLLFNFIDEILKQGPKK